MCFILRDEGEKVLGGITGTIFWYKLNIDFLWVDESLKGPGYGKKLLKTFITLGSSDSQKSTIFLAPLLSYSHF
ncbi:GNAT family N-acetyltransferase [Metabacillus herbersteinensis]|uniref:GNAT family N-acetyltransferase n=1 Tax=Metabacillus herbersteinensis TaxID=283816 RepID=A0ABV6GFW3_9BACI